MPLLAQQVYFITDTRVSGLTHPQQVEALIRGGAALIQLRDKHGTTKDFYEAALASIKLARPAGVLIIINDRVDIAIAVGADGVHLGQNDLPPARARVLLGEGAIIGLSTHNLEQALAAIGEPVDYIAIGPVFHTSTKPDADPVVGLEGVAAVRQAIGNMPLTAIGGVSSANLGSVLAAGADAAAVITAALDPPRTIANNAQALLMSC